MNQHVAPGSGLYYGGVKGSGHSRGNGFEALYGFAAMAIKHGV